MTDASQDETPRAIREAIEELRTAFPPHPLDVRTAFDEWGVTYTDGTSFQDGAQGKQWDELSPRFLEFHHDAPLFLGPPVVGDVLPAYLAAALRRDRELSMLPAFLLGALTRGLDRNDKRFDAQFGRLSPAQRHAITHALEAWEGSLDDPERRRPITEALDSYWRITRSEG